ncbi:DUF3189 family protein [Candidatus Formimonas warabiya]|uniref:DUF3189 family protein n=1 Tax=Formimonas warabiya TaxID=1761012 RepID=A0A3G1KNR9_FORW1|nr:DUF3189 family protein [Candidatus Formimonas warabiya]ATW24109.1 hypothetical protein DCMF_04330 [Candidatus Formimonas warabiya]
MIILYCGYSGVHSAVVAAAAHLGKLPGKGAVQPQLPEVPFFGSRVTPYQMLFHGTDQKGNKIYSLGVGHEAKLIFKAIRSFLDIMHIPSGQLIAVNTAFPLGRMSKWGEYLAFRGWYKAGNYLSRKGLREDLPALMDYLEKELSRRGTIDLIPGMMDNNGEIIESGGSL